MSRYFQKFWWWNLTFFSFYGFARGLCIFNYSVQIGKHRKLTFVHDKSFISRHLMHYINHTIHNIASDTHNSISFNTSLFTVHIFSPFDFSQNETKNFLQIKSLDWHWKHSAIWMPESKATKPANNESKITLEFHLYTSLTLKAIHLPNLIISQVKW